MNVSCGFHGAGTTIISARVHTCLAAYDKQHKHNVHCRSGDKLLNGFAAKHATTDWGMSGLMFLSQTVRYCQRTCVMSMCAIVNVSSYLNACMRVSSLKAPHVPVIKTFSELHVHSTAGSGTHLERNCHLFPTIRCAFVQGVHPFLGRESARGTCHQCARTCYFVRPEAQQPWANALTFVSLRSSRVSSPLRLSKYT